MFDPKTKKFPYPEKTDGHYLKIYNDNGLVFDKDFPYINNSKMFKFKRFWLRIIFYAVIVWISNIRLGLRVKGRKNLKKHKEVIKNGIVSCCNHIHMWDFIGISYAIRPYKPRFLAWAKNIKGALGKPILLLGGVPIPENNVKGSMSFVRSIGDHLNNGGWLHIYPEGSAWEFYKPIRPFKRGVSVFACKYDKPILPMAYTYRKPGFIRKVIFKQIAVLTLNIGEPIYRNPDLPKHEQELDLTTRAHQEICKLANIDPSNNIYEPIYNDTKKVEYY